MTTTDPNTENYAWFLFFLVGPFIMVLIVYMISMIFFKHKAINIYAQNPMKSVPP